LNTFIIILLVFLVLFILYKKYIKNELTDNIQQIEQLENEINKVPLDDETIHTDELGRKYKEVTVINSIPRKTYILGVLSGKFRGDIDIEKENEFINAKFFDFHIYEALINQAKIRKDDEGPFKFVADASFPKEKLPKNLPCNFESKEYGLEFGIILHEPQVKNVYFDRKHHQTDGKEVFGLITAEITGYILDFITETHIERNYILYEPNVISGEVIQKSVFIIPEIKPTELTRTNIATGNTEYKDNYQRSEFYYSDFKKTYWDNWKYNKSYKSESQEGCFSSLLWIIAVIFGIPFLLLLLPQLLYLLPIFLISLLGLIPSVVWRWILRFLAGIVLLFFAISIISFFINGRSSSSTNPVVTDIPKEVVEDVKVIEDSLGKPTNDSLIFHYREWTDYDGKVYNGRYWIKTSDFSKSSSFKRNLQISSNLDSGYDRMLFDLKENDKESLKGIFQLFDSLRLKNSLSRNEFAEMVVTFVQDIPYSIILPEGCDPSLYTDSYVKSYLNSSNASCDGYQKFGINSPVEFLASLKGDCDTRTLFLYTVLAHYNYDVALLSSEQYSHSILGINLNYSGKAYNYENQRYVFWETTAPNFRPGVLSSDLSNQDYWRISLKSK
jgi:hypothetical protein